MSLGYRICSMYKDVQITNVNEVFGWAVVGRPSRAGPHRRDGTRRLCLLPETKFAYIIHTNRLQTRSRDASASLAFHTQQRAEQPRTPAAHANIMRSPTTAPPTRFSPRQRPDGSTCATFCAARCTQAPEYSSNQKGFTFRLQHRASFCLPFIVKSTWNPCAYPRKRSVTPSTCHQNAREASSVVAKMRIERGVCFRRNDRQARRHNRPVARQRV